MPRKIRELETDLARAGFTKKPGKGSHRKWIHPKAKVNISGRPGDDAQPYQEQDVREAIRKAQQA